VFNVFREVYSRAGLMQRLEANYRSTHQVRVGARAQRLRARLGLGRSYWCGHRCTGSSRKSGSQQCTVRKRRRMGLRILCMPPG
jgi:hypothetical protein